MSSIDFGQLAKSPGIGAAAQQLAQGPAGPGLAYGSMGGGMGLPSGMGGGYDGRFYGGGGGGGADAYGQALGLYGGYAEPQMANYDTQDALIRMKQTGLLAGQDLTQQQLQSQYGIGMDRASLGRQVNNAAMRGTQADIDYYRGIQDLAQQYYGTQSGLFGRGRDIASDWLNTQLGLIGQSRGLKTGESDINLANVLRDYAHQKFLFGSQQAGSGAWNTVGTGEGFSNLAQSRDMQSSLIRNQLAQSLLGLDKEAAGAQHGYQTDILGIDTSQASAYNQLQQDLLRGGHGSAQAQASLDALKLKGQEYGIDERELADKLQQGLASLNLDTTLKSADLFAALSSNDFQRQQVASGIIAQAMQASGYMPGTSGAGGMSSGPRMKQQ